MFSYVMTNAPAFTVTGEPMILIAGPFSEIVAWPLVIVMPAAVTMMRGLVGLATGPEQIITPPPGTPNTVTELRPVVCSTMFGVGGGDAIASSGSSIVAPQKQPVQIG